MALTKVTYSMISGSPANAQDFGASVSATAAENTAAIQAALDSSLNVVLPADENLTAYQIDAPLVIQPNGSLDISGARITSTNTGIIRFSGSQGTLIGNDSVLTTTSTSSGYAVGLDDQSVACSVKIFGYPIIEQSTTTAYSIKGIDMTRFYRSYLEVAVNNFTWGIYANGSTYATYYNVLQKPSIRTGTDGIGIQLTSVNACDIVAPFISGAGIGSTGIEFINGSSKQVFGGYIEAFKDTTGVRGLIIDGNTGTTVVGTTFDTTGSAANYAIEVKNTSTGTTLINTVHAGAWADSSKIILYTASGTINFIGNSYTDTIVLGRTTMPSLTSANTYVNGLNASGQIVQTSNTGSGYTSTLENTSTSGSGQKITLASTNPVNESQQFTRAVAGRLFATQVGASNYPSVFISSGSPEGVYTATVGSICMNVSGGAGTAFYVKETGTGNTGWVGK